MVTAKSTLLSFLRLAIAGDLHGAWCDDDLALVLKLKPDALLFVGDLSEGDLRLVKQIQQLPLPIAIILGNHDRGHDSSGRLLQAQLSLLGELHCGWQLRNWQQPPLAVVGARPCSGGGGFFLSKAVQAVYGPMTSRQSADRIVEAAGYAPLNWPLVILAHSGPTGLGSEPNSLCGRDWKRPSMDWGDQDLAIALDEIRVKRIPDLVVFGHMHHQLKRGLGYRQTFFQDHWGTVYLNAACVPRRGVDESGDSLIHLAWAEFNHSRLCHVSQRWFSSDGSLAFKQTLFNTKPI